MPSLEDRMKANYENRTRYYLPRRTYTIVRVDGKAFHSYTRHLDRPFDVHFMQAMDEVGISLCAGIQGSQYAFVQSDEVSVLVTDFDKANSDAWFDGNLQKIVSVAASMATMSFNRARLMQQDVFHNESIMLGAMFDARAFTIPDPVEVGNYFIWRQQDATRNSIQMSATVHYSQTQLHGKDQKTMQEMLWSEIGINWNDYPNGFKRGRMVRYDSIESGWHVDDHIPVFTQDRPYLDVLIPKPGYEVNEVSD